NLLFAPLVRFMDRRLRIPKPIGAFVIVVGFLGGIAVAFYALSAPAADWMTRLPSAMVELESKLQPLRQPVEEVRKAARKVEEMARNERPPGEDRPSATVVPGPSLALTVLGQTTAISAGMLVATVLLLFLLASGDTLLRQAISIT